MKNTKIIAVANQKGAAVDAALFDEFLNNKAGDKQ